PPTSSTVVWTDYSGNLIPVPPSQSTIDVVGVQPGGSTTVISAPSTQPVQQPSQTQQPGISIGNDDVSVGVEFNPYTGDPSLHVGLGPIDIGFGLGNQNPYTPTVPVSYQNPEYGTQPPVVYNQPDPYSGAYQPPQQTHNNNVPTNNGSYVDPYGYEHWYDPIGQIVKTLTPDGTNVIYNDDGSRLVYGGNGGGNGVNFIPPADQGQIYNGTQVPVGSPVETPVYTQPISPTAPPVNYGDPLNPPISGGAPTYDPYVPQQPNSGSFTPQPTPPLPFEPTVTAPINPTPADPVSAPSTPSSPVASSDPLQPAQQQQNTPAPVQRHEDPEDIANKLDVNFEPLRPEIAEEKQQPRLPFAIEEKPESKDSSGSLLSDYEHRIKDEQGITHFDGAEGLKGAGTSPYDQHNVSAAEASAMAAETQAAINALIQHLSEERHEEYTEAVKSEDRKYSEIAEDIRESREREDDSYRKHADYIADLREKELEGYKQRDEAARERKEKEEEKDKKLTDTMLMALANRREQDVVKARQDAFWAEQQKKEEQVRQDNKQTKYLVRPNDTIESIAGKRLRDPKLAELIYQINKDKIEIKYENGKKVYVVKEGCVLTLPSPRQIREFRQQQRLGVLTQQNSSDNVVSMESKAAADQRRANVEKLLGKIGNTAEAATNKYNVRLGDTLRSVAMKHPQLGDVTLWKLLAEKNGLSTTTDHKGVPTAALRRGTQIILPTTEEIAQYRDRMRGESITSWNSSRYETSSRQCPNCHRLTTTEASSCPGCTYAFDGVGKEVDVEVRNQPLIAASTKTATITSSVPKSTNEDLSELETISLEGGEDDETVITGGKGANSFNVFSENLDPDERKWVEQTILNSLIEKLGENCRVVESTTEDHVVRTQLEVLTGDVWVPILSYEINENTSVRHEFASDGKQRTMPIDLPAAAAQELIHNDLQSNWQEYCRKYLAGKRLTA
ncbi:MAG: hypothetical protein C0507_24095, partial [Cyanobacteria bacterium PR.3.49]|nr:hypothetical protein [Cyanobacteria bacterium PR.3.49]